jgi:hypothetical protein
MKKPNRLPGHLLFIREFIAIVPPESAADAET